MSEDKDDAIITPSRLMAERGRICRSAFLL